MSELVAYQLRTRRLELTAVVASAGLSALLWRKEIPTRLFRADLSPEQMLQLFAVLQATCFLLALRQEHGDTHLRLASIRIRVYTLALTGAILAVYAVVGCAAAAAMPTEAAATYLRNLAAYAGVGLLLCRGPVTAAITVIWLWLAVSMSTGRSLVEGHVAFQWWAYPLHDPTFHPEVAVLLVALGSAARILR